MFGCHSYESAKRIADQKTRETGKKHAVLPVLDGSDLYTIGVPCPVVFASQLVEKLKGRVLQ